MKVEDCKNKYSIHISCRIRLYYHLQSPRRNITDGSLDVVRDPLHEIGGVLVLDVQHLLVHLLHRHPAPEDRGHGQIPAVPGVAGRHHVLGVEHLQ